MKNNHIIHIDFKKITQENKPIHIKNRNMGILQMRLLLVLIFILSYNSYGKSLVPDKSCKNICLVHWEEIYKIKKTDVTKKDYYYLLSLCTAYCQMIETKKNQSLQTIIK